jgi:hypothetical protein
MTRRRVFFSEGSPQFTVLCQRSPTAGASGAGSALAARFAPGDAAGTEDRVEQDSQNEGGNTSMQGQLGQRDENAELKNADSDLSG